MGQAEATGVGRCWVCEAWNSEPPKKGESGLIMKAW